MDRKIVLFAVTTFSAQQKATALAAVRKTNLSVSIIADLEAQLDVILDPNSSESEYNAAIALLTDSSTVWYANINKTTCASIASKLNKLEAEDFVTVKANRTAYADTTYLIKDGSAVEFHVQWKYNAGQGTFYSIAYTQGGSFYTLTPSAGSETTVQPGESFSFKVAVGVGSSALGIVAANGTTLTADVDGVYTIEDVQENQVITVAYTKKTYVFTLSEGANTTLVFKDGTVGATKTVNYGDSVIVTAGVSDTYTLSVENGATEIGTEEGDYTVSNITAAITISTTATAIIVTFSPTTSVNWTATVDGEAVVSGAQVSAGTVIDFVATDTHSVTSVTTSPSANAVVAAITGGFSATVSGAVTLTVVSE